jgi:TrmH family RNA methyltransferase
MEKIGKNHDKYKLMKDYIKKCPLGITISDDLQVLSIAVEYNLEIDLLLYDYETEYKEDTKDLLNKLINKANEVYEISHTSYSTLALKENHAGIIALIKLKEYQKEDFKDFDFIMVLDRLEIPGNIGTIYRTLDSAKCDGVILVDPISKINNEKITSSSRGCNLIIPTLSMSYNEAQEFINTYKFNAYLGEPKLGLNYQEYDYDEKVAIVVGNERFGINPDWYNHKNKMVYIPMDGCQNSLNVGVAASILAYEVYMKKRSR